MGLLRGSRDQFRRLCGKKALKVCSSGPTAIASRARTLPCRRATSSASAPRLRTLYPLLCARSRWASDRNRTNQIYALKGRRWQCQTTSASIGLAEDASVRKLIQHEVPTWGRELNAQSAEPRPTTFPIPSRSAVPLGGFAGNRSGFSRKLRRANEQSAARAYAKARKRSRLLLKSLPR